MDRGCLALDGVVFSIELGQHTEREERELLEYLQSGSAQCGGPAPSLCLNRVEIGALEPLTRGWRVGGSPATSSPLVCWPEVAERLASFPPGLLVDFGPWRARFYDPRSSKLVVFRVPDDPDLPLLKMELVPLILMTLVPRSSLVVHAAGVSIDGHGLAIAGPSGFGKSTAAKLLGGHLLSDDIVAIIGAAGHPELRGTTLGGRTDGDAPCPLRAILFPHKSADLRMVRLAPRAALRQFLREHSCYLFDTMGDAKALTMRVVGDLFDHVPAFELHFPLSGLDTMAVLDTVLSRPRF